MATITPASAVVIAPRSAVAPSSRRARVASRTAPARDSRAKAARVAGTASSDDATTRVDDVVHRGQVRRGEKYARKNVRWGRAVRVVGRSMDDARGADRDRGSGSRMEIRYPARVGSDRETGVFVAGATRAMGEMDA